MPRVLVDASLGHPSAVKAVNDVGYVLFSNGAVLSWGNSDNTAVLRENARLGVVAGVPAVPFAGFLGGAGRTGADWVVTSVAAGFDHGCALFASGGLRCFGVGARGGLGYDSEQNLGWAFDTFPLFGGLQAHEIPYVPFAGTERVTHVSCGNLFSCAVFDNGAARCWGDNHRQQLGLQLGYHVPAAGDGKGPRMTELAFLNFSDTAPIVQIEAGLSATCALFLGGRLRCFGSGTHGVQGADDAGIERGDGVADLFTMPPITFITASPVAEVQMSLYHAAAVFDDRSVVFWGNGAWQNLGENYRASKPRYGVDSGNGSVSAAPLDGTEVVFFRVTPRAIMTRGNGSVQLHGPAGWLGNITALRLQDVDTGLFSEVAVMNVTTSTRMDFLVPLPSAGFAGRTVVRSKIHAAFGGSGAYRELAPEIVVARAAEITEVTPNTAKLGGSKYPVTLRGVRFRQVQSLSAECAFRYSDPLTGSLVQTIVPAEIKLSGAHVTGVAVCSKVPRGPAGYTDGVLGEVALRLHDNWSPPGFPTVEDARTGGGEFSEGFPFQWVTYHVTAVTPNMVPIRGGTTITLSGPRLLIPPTFASYYISIPGQNIDLPPVELPASALVGPDGALRNGSNIVISTQDLLPQFALRGGWSMPTDILIKVSFTRLTWVYGLSHGRDNVFLYDKIAPLLIHPHAVPVGTAVPSFALFASSVITRKNPTCAIRMIDKGGVLPDATFPALPESYGGEVLVDVPAYDAPMTANVHCTNDMQAFAESDLAFTVFEAREVRPAWGPTGGGTVVRVLGENFVFSSFLTCRFGGDASTAATFVSDTEVTCATPPAPAGAPSAVHVELSISPGFYGGGPNSTFRYYDSPAVADVAPLSGSPRPADAAPWTSSANVSITGTGFVDTGLAACRFGEFVTPAVYASPSEIVCSLPAADGTRPVLVAVNGADFVDTGREFAFMSVLAVTPSRGVLPGGTLVTVVGDGLPHESPLARCRFGGAGDGTGGVDAPFLPGATSARATCVSPGGAAMGLPGGGLARFAVTGDGEFDTEAPGGFTVYTSVPSVTAVTPESVHTVMGSMVTVFGTGFPDPGPAGSVVVRVGVIPVVVASASASSAVAALPHAGGVLPVEISHNFGTEYSSSVPEVTVTFYSLLSLFPRAGPSSGGGVVTVTGADFPDSRAAVCRFGNATGAPESPALRVSPNAVSCPQPPIAAAGAAGATKVFYSSDGVAFPSHEYALDFDVYETPRITSVSPPRGPPFGVTVTVHGTGFTNSTRLAPLCRFGRVVVEGSLVADGGPLLCAAPAAVGPSDVATRGVIVNLDISLNAGGVFTGDNKVFSFFDVLAIDPKFGPDAGGTEVTISGGGFINVPTLSCRFGASAPVPASYDSASQLRCASPPLATGVAQHVTVSIDGVHYTGSGPASSLSALAFRAFAAPSVTAIDPTFSPSHGSTVTVYGSNFPLVPLVPPSCAFGPNVIFAGSSTGLGAAGNGSLVCAGTPGSALVAVEASFNAGVDKTADGILLQYYALFSIEPALGPVTAPGTVDLAGSGFSALSPAPSCRFGAVVVPATVLSAVKATCAVPPQAAGTVAVDYSHDGLTFTEAGLPYTYYPRPDVSAISPRVGPSLGAVATLEGSGFAPALAAGAAKPACVFGARVATATIISPTKMSCIVPEGSSTVLVRASLNDGNDADGSAASFTYFDIFAAVPALGPVAGGTGVFVSGSGFEALSGITCRFGSADAPGTFVSSAQIRCEAPAAAAPGSVFVEISLDGIYFSVEGKAQFSYYGDPHVTAVVPLSGPSVGIPVTVYGTRFADHGSPILCKFGVQIVAPSTPVASVAVDGVATDTTYVVCAAPPGTAAIVVELSLNDGHSFTDDRTTFSYFTVTRVSPVRGPSRGGTDVLLTGLGFVLNPAAQCKFGSARSPAIIVSPTETRCVAPKLLPGRVAIEFSSDAILTTSSGLFYEVYETPVAVAVSPLSLPSRGSTEVTVFGRAFANDTLDGVLCRFGTKNMPAGGFAYSGAPLDLHGVVCASPTGRSDVNVEVSFNAGADFTEEGLTVRYFEMAGISPRASPAAGGAKITVTGAGFRRTAFPPHDATAACIFAAAGVLPSVASPATYADDGELTCATPALPAGQYGVSVTMDGLEATAAAADVVVFSDPSVTAIQPSTAPALDADRSWITLHGAAFPDTSAVAKSLCLFGAIESSSLEYLDAQRVRCLAPAQTLASVVAVSFNDGASVAAGPSIEYFAALSFDPTSGPRDAVGNVIDVEGSGFVDAGADLRCVFGGRAGVEVPAAFLSSERVRCPVPPFDPARMEVVDADADATAAGQRAVVLGVTANGVGYALPQSGVLFTYYRTPEVTAIVPASGHTSGAESNLLTIHGSNFIPGAGLACRFDGAGVGDFSDAHVVNSSVAICSPDAHAAGAVAVDLSYNRRVSHDIGIPYNYTLCPVGHVSPSVDVPCEACLPGFYSPEIGGKKCARCPATGFSSAAGSSACEPCPEHTSIPTASRSNRSQCGCDEGFYQPDGIAGDACVPCVRGGFCAGEFEGPAALPGFWSDPGEPLMFLACDTPEACPGGEPGTCRNGYSQRLCASCEVGTYAMGGRCEPCPAVGGWRLGAFIVFCFGLIGVLIKSVGKNAAASGGVIGISTFFFQVLSMLRKLDLSWPPSLRFAIDIATLPFTFDMDALASECAFPVEYHVKWFAMWFTPFSFLGGFLVWYLLLSVVVLIKGRSGARGEPPRVTMRVQGEPTVEDPPPTNSEMLNRCINAYLLFITLAYMLPVTKSFEAFDCSTREDGSVTLDASPSLLCYEAWWYKILPFAAVGVALYTIILPLSFVVIVHRNREKLDDPAFISRYGSVFVDFKPEVPYWEATIMAQKVFMLVPIIFFTGYREFQISAFLLVIFLGLTIQLVMRPFFLERYNRLQTVLRWCSCLMLLIGMSMRANLELRHDRDADETVSVWGTEEIAMLGIAFLLLAVGVVTIIGVIAFDVTVIHWELRRKLDRSLLRNIDRLFHPHGKTEMIQWLGKDSLGQEFEVPLRRILNSISLDWRIALAEAGTSQLPSCGKHDGAPIDRFINLYCGTVFTRPVVPIVRAWILKRVAAAPDDDGALVEVTNFSEVFSQFSRFQRRLRESKAFFVRPERGVSRVDAARFHELNATDDGHDLLQDAARLISGLHAVDIVSEPVLMAIVKHVHRNNMHSLRLLNSAMVALQAMRARDKVSDVHKYAVVAGIAGGFVTDTPTKGAAARVGEFDPREENSGGGGDSDSDDDDGRGDSNRAAGARRGEPADQHRGRGEDRGDSASTTSVDDDGGGSSAHPTVASAGSAGATWMSEFTARWRADDGEGDNDDNNNNNNDDDDGDDDDDDDEAFYEGDEGDNDIYMAGGADGDAGPRYRSAPAADIAVPIRSEDAVGDVRPFLETMYEGCLADDVVALIAKQVTRSQLSAEYMLSPRSPFRPLHELFVYTRDDREEDRFDYEFADRWEVFDPHVDDMDDVELVEMVSADEDAEVSGVGERTALVVNRNGGPNASSSAAAPENSGKNSFAQVTEQIHNTFSRAFGGGAEESGQGASGKGKDDEQGDTRGRSMGTSSSPSQSRGDATRLQPMVRRRELMARSSTSATATNIMIRHRENVSARLAAVANDDDSEHVVKASAKAVRGESSEAVAAASAASSAAAGAEEKAEASPSSDDEDSVTERSLDE